jgi:hypothetical protein
VVFEISEVDIPSSFIKIIANLFLIIISSVFEIIMSVRVSTSFGFRPENRVVKSRDSNPSASLLRIFPDTCVMSDISLYHTKQGEEELFQF